MDQHSTDQLDKVIAMADYSHESEAVVAIRKARQVLMKCGLSFGDLAQAALSHRAKPSVPMSGKQLHLEAQLFAIAPTHGGATSRLKHRIGSWNSGGAAPWTWKKPSTTSKVKPCGGAAWRRIRSINCGIWVNPYKAMNLKKPLKQGQ